MLGPAVPSVQRPKASSESPHAHTQTVVGPRPPSVAQARRPLSSTSQRVINPLPFQTGFPCRQRTNERTNLGSLPPHPPFRTEAAAFPHGLAGSPPPPPSAGRAPVWPASRSRSLLFLLVALRCVALGCVLRARARPPAALTTQNVVGWSSNRRGSSPRTHGNHPADASLLPTGAPTAGLGRRAREPLRARPAGRKGSNHDHGVS